MTLKDAFDQEKFVIDDKEYTDQDFQAMSLDDLETLKMQITKKINGLSTAIGGKKMDYANGGKGASGDWMKRHKNALTINQRVLTYVNYLIKKRHRSDRKISDYFMEAARTILAKNEFESILSIAHNEMKTKGI